MSTTNDTGSPMFSVLAYAIPRGEYDNHLWELEKLIHKRRERLRSVGLIAMSIGDTLELFDDLKKKTLRSAQVRVVRIPSNRSKITVRITKMMHPQQQYLDRVVTIPREWVYFRVEE